jgi:hypothetical protein
MADGEWRMAKKTLPEVWYSTSGGMNIAVQ